MVSPQLLGMTMGLMYWMSLNSNSNSYWCYRGSNRISICRWSRRIRGISSSNTMRGWRGSRWGGMAIRSNIWPWWRRSISRRRRRRRRRWRKRVLTCNKLMVWCTKTTTMTNRMMMTTKMKITYIKDMSQRLLMSYRLIWIWMRRNIMERRRRLFNKS